VHLIDVFCCCCCDCQSGLTIVSVYYYFSPRLPSLTTIHARCVLDCGWVGNCIGKRNYRFFCSFVFSTCVLSGSVLALSCFHLAVEASHSMAETWAGRLNDAIRETPVRFVVVIWIYPLQFVRKGYFFFFFFFLDSVALGVYLAVVFFFALAPLACFHFYLLLVGRTTFEQVKTFSKSESSRLARQQGLFNLVALFWGPRHSSWLQRTEHIMEEEVEFLKDPHEEPDFD